MNQFPGFKSLSTLMLILGLAACGGGGGGGGTNAANGVLVGTITGFGSVYVNGMRFDTTGTEFVVNDDNGGEDDLHVGMRVKVTGDYDDDTNSGHATEIEYDRDLEGPISSVNMIDATTTELVILGVTVIVNDETRLVGVSKDGLMVGMVVEVSGVKDSSGAIVATWLKLESDNFSEGEDELEVEGIVSELDTTAKTFEINGYVIDYSNAMLEDFNGPLEEGMYVEVEGKKFGPSGELLASEIEYEGDELYDDADNDVRVDGYVTLVSGTEFYVNGYLVEWGPYTKFENGYPDDLLDDVYVIVDGYVDAKGTIMAETITYQYGDTEDYARDIVKDSMGNVYVTGSSKGEYSGFDYLTVKYDADGNKVWARRYNSFYNDEDYATAITLDDFGNVYVTGYSKSNDKDFDYATVKYDPDGMQMWVMRYDGYFDEDVANDIVTVETDDGLVVVVTGYSKGDSSDYDYATVAYHAADGAEAWSPKAMRYDGYYSEDRAQAIAAADGYVYVTGSSKGDNSDYDFATLAYDAATGEKKWPMAMRYDGYYAEDGANDIVTVETDDGLVVVVTGYSKGDNSDYDYATVAYHAADGTEAWSPKAMRYDGYYSEDRAQAIAAADGYVYVTGYSKGDKTDYDYATLAYDAATGAEQWLDAMRYDSGYFNEDKASDIVVADGFVVVTGASKGDNTDYDYATVSYAVGNGMEQWARRYDSGYFDDDQAQAITAGGGSINVTGYSKTDKTDYDYATLQYDNNGNTMWMRRTDGYSIP